MAVYDDVFAALHVAGVQYVVVGSVGVVMQGRLRTTVDLAPEQAASAVMALKGLGLRPRQLAMSDARSEATYAGKERGQRRRAVSLTGQQRLEWLEDELRKAEGAGVLARIRDRKQRRLLNACDEGG